MVRPEGAGATCTPVMKMPSFPDSSIVNAMTVDVEDYYQVSAFASVVSRDRWGEYESRVAANTDRLLSLFAEAGVRATFFVLGWVAERDPELVRRIAVAGHEIASHGYGHQLVYDQRPEQFREDVRRAKSVLEAATGRPVVGYRAPSFSITRRSLWAVDVLIEEGFIWDASIFPIRHDRYGIPSAPRHPFWIRHGTTVELGWPAFASRLGMASKDGPETRARSLLEIPASTIRLGGTNFPIGGGGYFRLLPYVWTEWGFGRVNRLEGRPVWFYLHPWEVDPDQPRFNAGWLSRFRHYRNLDRTEDRLRRLLSEFRFGTVGSAILARSGCVTDVAGARPIGGRAT